MRAVIVMIVMSMICNYESDLDETLKPIQKMDL